MTRCVPDATPSYSKCWQAQLTARSLQVTIWEALTNSKPGTHPMSCEGRRQDRSVPMRLKRTQRCLFPLLPPTHMHRDSH